LDWLRVEFAAAIGIDKSDPLQSFSRSLSDPGHPRAAECESRGCTGQCVGFSRSFNHWFRFCQSLTINTCQDKKENCQMFLTGTFLKTQGQRDCSPSRELTAAVLSYAQIMFNCVSTVLCHPLCSQISRGGRHLSFALTPPHREERTWSE